MFDTETIMEIQIPDYDLSEPFYCQNTVEEEEEEEEEIDEDEDEEDEVGIDEELEEEED